MKITTADAARVISLVSGPVSPLFVRHMMRKGKLDIGEADVQEGAKRWNYHIMPNKLMAYTHCTMEEIEAVIKANRRHERDHWGERGRRAALPKRLADLEP